MINVTFIYSGRWIGAGWVTPLTDFIADPKHTPADWGGDDFLPGATAAFKDLQGRLCAIPWIADVQMAGASRYDLIEKAGMKLPDTFDEMATMLKAVNKQDNTSAFIVENHYGWSFIPYLQGFGGDVFRKPPTDLMPLLDTPEAVAAADFFCNMLREYGPDGVLSYTYDQVVETLRQARANYSTNNETFLVQMGLPESKSAKTCALSMMPGGPKGRFPNVAAHGWGIPVGSRNKDAAWEFITWAMSKELCLRMFRDHGYSSVTRRSVIDMPEFKQRMMINGTDVAKLYVDTLNLELGLHGVSHRGAVSAGRSGDRHRHPVHRVQTEDREGGDGAGPAECADAVEARRREAVGFRHGGQQIGRLVGREELCVSPWAGAGTIGAGRGHPGASDLPHHHQPDAADAGKPRHGTGLFRAAAELHQRADYR